MSVSLSNLESVEPEKLRTLLIHFLSHHVADMEDGAGPQARAIINSWDDQTLIDLREKLTTLGNEITLYESHKGCRDVARAWGDHIVTSTDVEGVNHLTDALDSGPTLLICNHLSYFDTTGTDLCLANAGLGDIADKIFALAGPKVYSDLFRRYAAACLNTLPVPQSASIGHGAKLSPRDLAKLAIESTKISAELTKQGRIPLLYAEGSRSRDGRLQPFLRGVRRYLDVPELRVVPMVILGSWDVMPVGSGTLHSAPVKLKFGPAIEIDEVGYKAALDIVHMAVGKLLPDAHKPLIEQTLGPQE